MSLVDSHCHLDDSQFDSDREAVIERALAGGVSKMLAIGTGEGPPDLEAAIRLADGTKSIYATAGIHPQYAPKLQPTITSTSLPSARDTRSASPSARSGSITTGSPSTRNCRRSCLHRADADRGRGPEADRHPHARSVGRHDRPAPRALGAHGLPCIMHCFTGGADEAKQALDLGFYLSFAGVLTYPESGSRYARPPRSCPSTGCWSRPTRPICRLCRHRGKRNEPAYVCHTANKLAEVRGEEPARLARSHHDELSTAALLSALAASVTLKDSNGFQQTRASP